MRRLYMRLLQGSIRVTLSYLSISYVILHLTYWTTVDIKETGRIFLQLRYFEKCNHKKTILLSFLMCFILFCFHSNCFYELTRIFSFSSHLIFHFLQTVKLQISCFSFFFQKIEFQIFYPFPFATSYTKQLFFNNINGMQRSGNNIQNFSIIFFFWKILLVL